MFRSLIAAIVFPLYTFSENRFCLFYEAPDFCGACSVSYPDLKGRCVQPPNPIDNCLQYSNAEDCSMCVYGYRLEGSVCQPIAPEDDCLCYQGRSCQLCKRGTKLIGESCERRRGCQVENCNHCGAFAIFGEFCLLCASGFVNFIKEDNLHSECVPETGRTNNCVLTIDGETCKMCEVNYYIDDGACKEAEVYRFDLDWLYRPTGAAIL